jgi:erythromycin esterase
MAAEVVFRFSVAADGHIKGSFDVPAQSLQDVSIPSITVSGAEVELKIPGLESTFRGGFDASGATIAGTWTHQSYSFPMKLTLVKRTLDARAEPMPAPKEVVEWIRREAIRLDKTENDIRLLREIVGNVRIVSVGEATYGIHEFFELKRRTLEFLVTGMGFTVLGIEANWPETLAVNEYVLDGRGDAAEALKGLRAWAWSTREALDLIQWMRRYNEDPAHVRKVKFLGFDMQSAHTAVGNLVAYLRKTDPEYAAAFERILEDLSTPEREAHYRQLPGHERRLVAGDMDELVQHFDRHKTKFVARAPEAEWAQARQHAEIVRQFTHLDDPGSRDRFMTANVKWILDQEPPGTKIMLWAHDGHVQTDTNGGFEPMGMHLRRMYCDAMVAIGFAFNQGSFRAIKKGEGLQEFTVPPAMVGSLDNALVSTGLPLFALDLRRAPQTGPVADWLAREQRSRQIAQVFVVEAEPMIHLPIRITRSFDALLFVEKTTPTAGLP